MKEKFEAAAKKINDYIKDGYKVFATWDETSVPIKRAEAVEREDGWHLLGFGESEFEHCIGGAIVIAILPETVLYSPE
jgi:hypothetical protein